MRRQADRQDHGRVFGRVCVCSRRHARALGAHAAARREACAAACGRAACRACASCAAACGGHHRLTPRQRTTALRCVCRAFQPVPWLGVADNRHNIAYRVAAFGVSLPQMKVRLSSSGACRHLPAEVCAPGLPLPFGQLAMVHDFFKHCRLRVCARVRCLGSLGVLFQSVSIMRMLLRACRSWCKFPARVRG